MHTHTQPQPLTFHDAQEAMLVYFDLDLAENNTDVGADADSIEMILAEMLLEEEGY